MFVIAIRAAIRTRRCFAFIQERAEFAGEELLDV
jgi:hypothetical protein